MNILEFENKHFGVEDLKEILPTMGHKLTVISTPLILERTSDEFDQLFDKAISKCNYDAVFTFNYSVVVSKCCNRHNIPYIAWVYDSPLMTLYSYTITNPCNHIFLFEDRKSTRLNSSN